MRDGSGGSVTEGRPVVLYIATSLDGYIADESGGIEWLIEADRLGEGDNGYAAFYDTVDTIVSGRRTYDQVLTLGEWPYAGKRLIVLTNRPAAPRDGVEFARGDVGALVRRLKGESGKGIWLLGGADLTDSFLREGLVDEIIVTIAPILLGGGIPLFRAGRPRAKLRLIATRRFGELAQIHYAVEG